VIEILIIAAAFIVLFRHLAGTEPSTVAHIAPRKIPQRLQQMSDYADRLYGEKKWLAAEKAYLQVLKVDHKNITAYSHLGIIYSTQKNMPDAIECFAIAARIHPSAVTFQNLGLAYYDNRNFVKSIAAFEKAIMFEPSVHRYVGLSKAQSKLHNAAGAAEALERAARLDPSPKLFTQLADAYTQAGRKDDAAAMLAKAKDPAAMTTEPVQAQP
jgi:tetratricopeptide (TPR) repeat protein